MAAIHEQILTALAQAPAGLSMAELRGVLGLDVGDQEQLGRRLRDLYKTNDIRKNRAGQVTRYVLLGPKAITAAAAGAVDRKTRFRVLLRDGGRCQMCGLQAKDAERPLQIDHRIPQSWDGTSDDDNLWTLCEPCNQGKRDFFETITDPDVRAALQHPQIHMRIGELLKAKAGAWVPKSQLLLVAWTHEDWEKRMRELRSIGWDYESRRRNENGRVRTDFRLTSWEPWPENIAGTIRANESKRREAR